ncbi:hypothetical protein K438DRAFT_1759893 [Mycena galopus ATCC 62051]|nr:hypothetical protein K438DRAFT_1759893 [Mycena galopus ATCC 62051]
MRGRAERRQYHCPHSFCLCWNLCHSYFEVAPFAAASGKNRRVEDSMRRNNPWASRQSESRQRSPPEHQQPQEKPRRRFRDSVRLIIPSRRHSSTTPEPTNNERCVSRRWSRAFCRPSPSPSLADAQENRQSAVYEDAEGKGDADAEPDPHTEAVLVLSPLDDSGHETPTPIPQVQALHLHVPQQQAEVLDSESQVRRVDEEVAPDGAAEEGENSDTDSAVEYVCVCVPLDDLDEETPTPVLHAFEMPLPAPAPHARVDDLEALDKDAGEGASAVVDSGVEDVSIRAPLDDLDDDILPIPQAQVPEGDEETWDGDAEEGGDEDADFDADMINDGDNYGDAEEGGEATADSSVEDVLVSVPLDNLDEDTPTPMTLGTETQVPVPPPEPQADGSGVADGDDEKGLSAGAVADSDPNLEDVHLCAPLDGIDNESPPIPQAQVPQGDEEETFDGYAEEGGVADTDSASDMVENGEAEKGGDPDSDSCMENVRVLTSLDDDMIPPILSAQPQTHVIEEAPDGLAVDGVDADVDANSGAEDMRVRAPLEDFDENVATPAPHAQVPQVEHDDQWIVHTTDVPSPSTLPIGVTGTSDTSNTLPTPPPVLVPATSDRQLDFPRSPFTANAMPMSLIATSFAQAAAASASPSSISPANASLSSSVGTLPQTPLRNLGNKRTHPWVEEAKLDRQGTREPEINVICTIIACPKYPAEAQRRAQSVTCWTCGAIGHYATDPACPRRYRR